MARKIFISYARTNRAVVESLEDDLKGCGHDPFIDRELSGGQQWWNELLRRIEQCDIFVPVLSGAYLKSVACGREMDYANALGKPFLPVAIEPVRPGLFHQRIAEAQWITYDSANRQSLLGLVRATDSLPTAPALPDPLPKRPEVPISYLLHLREEVQTAGDLAPGAQLRLMTEFKSRLGGDDSGDARLLLGMLRQRPDVSHQVATEIDQLLASSPPVPPPDPIPKPPPDSPAGPAPQPAPTPAPINSPSSAAKPDNYMVWSILATVFCCLPVGAAGIYFAIQVDKRFYAGDLAGAKVASQKAKLWTIISAGTAAALWLIYLLIMGVVAAANH